MLRLLVPLVLLIAAIGATVLTDHPRPRADFTFVNRGDATTLDVQRMSWQQDFRMARALFEGLVRTDVFTHEFRVIPAGAESWSVSDDGLTYTFHLRPAAVWSNGQPVTAEHYVYAWRRALLPDLATDYTGLFQKIRGGRAFFAWREEQLKAFKPEPEDDVRDLRQTAAWRLWEQTQRKFDEIVELKAVDSLTLRFTLERPTSYFLDLCAFPVFYPVYPPLVDQYERPGRSSGRLEPRAGWTHPPHLVTNGPFVLSEWRFKRDMRLESSPTYWNRAELALSSISIPSNEDANSQVLAFRTGSVDWLSDVGASYRADILAEKFAFYREHEPEVDRMRAEGLDPIEIDRRLPPDPRNRVHVFPTFGTYFFNFNCQGTLADGRANPFADPRVRRAFALCVDKQRIVQDIRRIGEPVASALIPPGSLGGYRSPEGLSRDPGTARRLLADAGYAVRGGPGRPFVTVELLITKDGGHDLVAQSMAKDWQAELGVEVAIDVRETSVFKADVRAQRYMISSASWFGDYGDPTTFLDLNRTGDGNNDRGYSSPRFDALLDSAEAERDSDRRTRILEHAERVLVEEDLPLIPIFHYVQMCMFDPHRITGISSHPRQEQHVYKIDVLGDGKGPDVPRALPPRPAAEPAAPGEQH